MPAYQCTRSFQSRRILASGTGVLAGLLLIAGLATPARATFPGSNGKIAFGWNDIYTVNSDGSELTNLTPGTPESFDGEPAWSPDGTKIAFSSDRANGLGGNTDIYVMNSDGSDPVRLTFNSAFEEWPAWSPDGQYIAFSRGEEFFGGEVLVMRADGSQVRRLIAIARGYIAHPAWSPDGSLIAFSGESRHFGMAIYVIKSDGSSWRRLTDPAGGYDHFPNWSPDGTKIVFSRRFHPDHFLWMMNADGSGLMPITSGVDNHPAWSPDGTRIVFQRFSEATSWDIWTMNSDGTDPNPIVQTPGDDQWPDWQSLP